ncbi:alpha/beta fold hydrolase [Nonomuraea diastatica]|uniref:Alpha/beta fold hydrolase n=1 Tax=Nonomuraea diastatica TaxID=1848329 RepID=A0A4R4WIS3_9ACTN|nr:alpha/beta fold hydrolase [Nonomuraea diastatica]TDD18301.1 alpha/beta fold hydrolase [Nonomuraea diastatica]
MGGWGEELERALAERATAVTCDRAGVGRSGGSQARTIAEMAEDLRRLLRALHLELPAAFVGWSYGGLVTQLYAARHPHDVAGLVFVDPSPAELRRARRSYATSRPSWLHGCSACARCSAAPVRGRCANWQHRKT